MTNIAQTDTYLVLGNPIIQSKSPHIHTHFADSTQQTLTYSSQLLQDDEFEDFVTKFFQQGGKGLNITMPFKQKAFVLADHASEAAQMAHAANTLWCNAQGEICADNTDGVGLVRDIVVNLQGTLKDKRILLLGAGGAVRGVLAPLLAQQPTAVVITNRTFAKAQQLVQEVNRSQNDTTLTASSYGDLVGTFDWVINGTASSIAGKLPPLPQGLLADKARTYDMMYAKTPTPFSHWALEAGAVRADDGLGMLVEQAAESFAIWRHIRPETKGLLTIIRESL